MHHDKKHKNESAMEYLRRVVNNLDHEHESLLDDLPSTAALVEYFELWSEYDTDFYTGICECIEAGGDPKPLAAFLTKWKLPWHMPREIQPFSDRA